MISTEFASRDLHHLWISLNIDSARTHNANHVEVFATTFESLWCHFLVFSNTAPYQPSSTGGYGYRYTGHPWKSCSLGKSHYKKWHRLSADESRGLEPACGAQTRGRKDSQERIHTCLQGMHAFRENKQNAGKLSEDHFLTAVFHSAF